jgi:hypothetical protein
MNCNTVQIAGTSGLAYLESATRFLEQGDFVSARFLVEEGIRLAGNISGLDVGDKLRDLFAFICLKERIGKSDGISILGRLYYAGTDADEELPVAHSSTPFIVH